MRLFFDTDNSRKWKKGIERDRVVSLKVQISYKSMIYQSSYMILKLSYRLDEHMSLT